MRSAVALARRTLAPPSRLPWLGWGPAPPSRLRRAAEVAGPGPRPAAAPGVRASLRGTQDDPSVRRGRYQAGSAAADAAYQAPSIRDGGDNLGVEMNRAVGCAQLQGDVGIHQSEGDGSVGGVDVV